MKYLFEKTGLYHLPKVDPSKISISGNNKKNILVVLKEDDFTEAAKSLLDKILKAIHCDILEDVTLIKIQGKQQISIKEYIDQFEAMKIISFGILPDQLSLHLSQQVKNYFQIAGVEFLFSPGLEVLMNDRNKKLALWNQLKQRFIL